MSIADKLTAIKQNVQRVFDAGYCAGQEAGGGGSYDAGLADGKKAQYDAFWDSAQQNGNRTNYRLGFSGNSWNDVTFKPKYDIIPTDAYQMFRECNITDLKGLCEELGITFSLANATTFQSIFNGAMVTHLGELDTRSADSAAQLLYGCKGIETVDKVILKDDGSQDCSNFTSSECRNLKEIRFEGVIGAGKPDFRWSKELSKQSILSIIYALSETSSGLTVIFSLEAVKKSFETSEGALDGDTSEDWLTGVTWKNNWTFSLI